MNRYLKAITAAILAALTTLAGLVANNADNIHIRASGWITVAIAFIVALGGVYAVPNAPGGTETDEIKSRLGDLESKYPDISELVSAVSSGIQTGLQSLDKPTANPAPDAFIEKPKPTPFA